VSEISTILDQTTTEHIGELVEGEDGVVYLEPNLEVEDIQQLQLDVRVAWEDFKGTSEYKLLSCQRIATRDDYITTLKTAMSLRGQKEQQINRCITWLEGTDFFTAPGSTRYHDSHPGGLYKHSIRTFNIIMELIKTPIFSSVEIIDAAIVALVHDWCKIGIYKSYLRNVKNEDTGQWEKVPAYEKVDSPRPFGHTGGSLYVSQQFIKMSMPMALAITWHMGRWNVVEGDYNDLTLSNKLYPIVHLLQFADQLSITDYCQEYLDE